jgi:hypothetical protein
MTIPFEKLKARLLANPKVKAEYDAPAPEFEITPRLSRPAKAGHDKSPPTPRSSRRRSRGWRR